MAQRITLTSGSIFNGNPITFDITPSVVKASIIGEGNATVSMHRVIVNVECGISGGNYEVIAMSSPVEAENGKSITIDISSALRVFRDSYDYTPDPVTYPLVKFNVIAYDEYLLDGEFFRTEPISYLPTGQHLSTIFGAFSDRVRFAAASPFLSVQQLHTRPTTPHLAVLGDTAIFPDGYSSPQPLASSQSLTAPSSIDYSLDDEGIFTVGNASLYVLPVDKAPLRQTFRFINSRGCLESISIPYAHQKKLSTQSEAFSISRQETFNRFSRAFVRKQNDRESWVFTTDPLDEAWLHWYLHEFLMSEHVWLYLSSIEGGSGGGSWLPVTITPDDDTTYLDKLNGNPLTLTFTAVLSLNG